MLNLTKREYVAMALLQSILSNPNMKVVTPETVENAVAVADMLIAQVKETQTHKKDPSKENDHEPL